ncbi:hypothetical protein SLEP1_g36937 [Rubroshorea leprosula]|uniref:Uncharacterized protein n=1 Tax=Rubroshorea leprosula TaxID=152421 RepID=A0AAV5KT99_9ROSI|nr:hypothetical protein SLEP1_g36937 [Rubroshorea leprosula]
MGVSPKEKERGICVFIAYHPLKALRACEMACWLSRAASERVVDPCLNSSFLYFW